MAILVAFNSPEVEVVGLTTVFGNVYTQTATHNAFKLLELAGMTQVMVSSNLSVNATVTRYETVFAEWLFGTSLHRCLSLKALM